MEAPTQSLQRLTAELAKLPGIGQRTAERLAYHILRASAEEAMALAYAIRDVKTSLRSCRACFHLAEGELCAICSDARRDPSVICIVEEPKDVLAIEKAGNYRGLYHVLLGAFAPLEGVTPADLTIEPLVKRLEERAAAGQPVRELILATSPNFAGDGTALLLRERLKTISGLVVTRIARGVPSGANLEHVSGTMLADAIEGRREVQG